MPKIEKQDGVFHILSLDKPNSVLQNNTIITYNFDLPQHRLKENS